MKDLIANIILTVIVIWIGAGIFSWIGNFIVIFFSKRKNVFPMKNVSVDPEKNIVQIPKCSERFIFLYKTKDQHRKKDKNTFVKNKQKPK